MKMLKHQHQRRNSAFTLVETVIVLAIIGIMLPIIFSILFTVARQQNKIYRLTEAKLQGDYAMNYMKSYIRNYGDELFQDEDMNVASCSDSVTNPDHTSQGGETMYFSKKNALSEYFNFQSTVYETDATGQDYSQLIFDNNGVIEPLTTQLVSIINFEISCFKKSASSTPFVFVAFTVYYKTNLASAAPEDQAILNYRGVVKMR